MKYSDRSQITINQIMSLPYVIQPRISKFSEEQHERMKMKGLSMMQWFHYIGILGKNLLKKLQENISQNMESVL